MPVRQLKKNKWTKDGRSWIFYLYERQIDGTLKQYTSKAFLTKEEAEREELAYRDKYLTSSVNPHMTFREAYLKFYEYKADKVRTTTLKTYRDRMRYMGILDNVELVNLNGEDYQRWRNEINKLDIRSTYKRDIQKFIKMVINFVERNYEFNLRKFYTKLEPFNDPNELEKEMRFYTPEEFYKFVAVITDLQMRCLFKTLYYCGLRRGEARGLTWDCIDLNNNRLYVKKQIVVADATQPKRWKIAPPKTKKSIRTLPLSNDLKNDLIELYNKFKQFKNFKDSWFVFGDIEPITVHKMNYQNEKNAENAGVKIINLHGFRHSCASMLINNNVNISVVSNYLGHADIEETLNTYTHMFENKLYEVADYIDNQANNLAKAFTEINRF